MLKSSRYERHHWNLWAEPNSRNGCDFSLNVQTAGIMCGYYPLALAISIFPKLSGCKVAPLQINVDRKSILNKKNDFNQNNQNFLFLLCKIVIFPNSATGNLDLRPTVKMVSSPFNCRYVAITLNGRSPKVRHCIGWFLKCVLEWPS